ncbi:hypothetical protein B0H13DRAFT_2301087 [Mycena leptocephala]|nr:hypothetical protein B0H13DRAFT_2301087 [Mycena leptocephala]
MDAWLKYYNKLKSELQVSLGKISFTVDMWSSAGMQPYLSVTIHWLGRKEEQVLLRQALLAFRRVRGAHGYLEGIQDISAFLPIIGTEKCECHVGEALEGGFLYAAAAPLTLFGSLGIIKAGVAILCASASPRAAKTLADGNLSQEYRSLAQLSAICLVNSIRSEGTSYCGPNRASFGLPYHPLSARSPQACERIASTTS